MTYLELRDLRVAFPTDDGLVRAVDGISFVLERGRIVQRGTHEELMIQEGAYRRIYDLQARVEEEVSREIGECDDDIPGASDCEEPESEEVQRIKP